MITPDSDAPPSIQLMHLVAARAFDASPVIDGATSAPDARLAVDLSQPALE
jgi:hypothetical protein